LKALIEAKLEGQPVATMEPARQFCHCWRRLQQSVAAKTDNGAAPQGKGKAPP